MGDRAILIILACLFPVAVVFSYLYGLWHNIWSARYAAYANRCAVEKKVPDSFDSWRKTNQEVEKRGISSP